MEENSMIKWTGRRLQWGVHLFSQRENSACSSFFNSRLVSSGKNVLPDPRFSKGLVTSDG
jgi:hypothetical protein